ncbi:MAG: MFS transporter, partial [Phycisphaeraceae bacterium]
VVPMVIWSIHEPVRPHTTIDNESRDQSAPARAPRGVIMLIYAIAFLGMIAFYAIPLQIPFHLKILTGANGTYAGLAIACMTLFATVSAMLYSRVKAKLSFPGVVAVMLLIVATGYLIVAMAVSYTVVLLGMMVAGLGLGLLMPNLNVWLMSHAPEASRGRFVGGLTMALFLGQFVSPIALRPLLAVWGTVGVFAALGVCMLAAMIGFAGYALIRPCMKARSGSAAIDAEP